jgi:hypothetical protein
LLTQYGAFQLVSFTSPDQGTNSAVVDISFHTVLPMKEGLLLLPSWCRERVHFRETLLYLARLAFNLPVVSPDRFRTFRLNLFAAAGFSFDTVLTVAGVGLLSGTACDDSILLLFPSAPRTWTSMVYFPLHSYSTKARCQCEITPETTSSVLHYSY